MGFGLIIIGDEILSGKREDKHFAQVRGLMAARGLRLDWVSYLGDDRSRLAAALAHSFAGGDIVFSCGGIGGTPDDHTRQAAAAALGLPLVLHPDARDLIAARMAEVGQPLTPDRLSMGEFPEGAEIIPNPFNRIPGFSLGEHHFLPGFPEMAWPMMEWVLDTRYAPLHAPGSIAERSIIVREAGESQLIDVMNQALARYPSLKVFSLPRMQPERYIELGVRGAAADVPAAIALIQAGVTALGFPWTDGPPQQ